MGKIVDRTGQRYGRLLVRERAPDRFTPGGQRGICWFCLCDCGATATVRASHLASGDTQSCGCFLREAVRLRGTTHGMTTSPEYRCWRGVLNRCRNRRGKDFPTYGGRGITVADEWLDFEAFYRDMGPRPSRAHSLDRIDNSKGYCPGNCRWATRIEQARNTRANVWVTFQGRRVTLAEAAELSGLPHHILHQRRRRGWPDSALFLPPGSKRRPQ
jgi:hypothetical protein